MKAKNIISANIAAHNLVARSVLAGVAPRIAILGDSTAELGVSYPYVSVNTSNVLCARSSAPYLTLDGVGELVIYANGTATWKAPGDSNPGPVTDATTGFVWLESDNPGKGMRFLIHASDIAGAAPGGTAQAVYLNSNTSYNLITAESGATQALVMAGFSAQLSGVYGMPSHETLVIKQVAQNMFDLDQLGKPLPAPHTIVYVTAGINDCQYLAETETPDYGIEDTLDNLTAIKDAILAGGAVAIFSSLSHETPGTLRPFMDQVNQHLSDMADASPKVFFADYRPVIDDPESEDSAALSGYMSGPHYSAGTGCYAQALVLKPLLDSILDNRVGRSLYLRDRQNLVVNGDAATADGVLVNATGESSWSVNTWESEFFPPTGDAVVSCSVEDVPGELHRRDVITAVTGEAFSYVVAQKSLSELPAALVAEVEITLDHDAGVPLPVDMNIYWFDSDGAWIDTTTSGGCRFFGMPVDGQPMYALLRTPVIVTPPEAVSARMVVSWFVYGTYITVTLANAGARSVPVPFDMPP